MYRDMEQQDQQSQPPVFNPQQEGEPRVAMGQPFLMPTPSMGFIEAVETCVAKSFDFKGRARRSEFWWFMLCGTLVEWGLSLLGSVFTAFNDGSLFNFFTCLGVVLAVILFIPQLSAATRRLHDTGRSGWWVFADAVPLAALIVMLLLSFLLVQSGSEGTMAIQDTMVSWMTWTALVLIPVTSPLSIIILVFALQDSKPEENKYGPSPKYDYSLSL